MRFELLAQLSIEKKNGEAGSTEGIQLGFHLSVTTPFPKR